MIVIALLVFSAHGPSLNIEIHVDHVIYNVLKTSNVLLGQGSSLQLAVSEVDPSAVQSSPPC